MRYLSEAHPELVEKAMAEGFTERDLRKAVGEAIMDARRQQVGRRIGRLPNNSTKISFPE
ncbi:MAG: hypothetical protein KIH01_03140 [Candidatus Freyarchaeota archaeon]|nr:hypothetical protein [Candidatus Jordarchaeia archaeon]